MNAFTGQLILMKHPGDMQKMDEIEVCEQSGYRPGEYCDSKIKVQVPRGNKVGVCPWHKKIHLNNK